MKPLHLPIFFVAAVPLLLVGCELEAPLHDVPELEAGEPTGASEAGAPASASELDEPPGPPEATTALCSWGGPTWQDVESYDGSLGPTSEFVDVHQRPVARLRWRDDLGARYDDYDDKAGSPFCTGTLISDDLLITAGHCISTFKFRTLGGDDPSVEQVSAEILVEFNYQNTPGGGTQTPIAYAVEATLERSERASIYDDPVDYAILHLDGAPGLRWGQTRLARWLPAPGSTLSIIQHPYGLPKVVEGGDYDGIELFSHPFGLPWEWVITYDDIDADGGSSGAGVLDERGDLIGVHVGGDCNDAGTGTNVAEPLEDIHAVSDVLDDLLEGDIPLVGDLDGGTDELVIYRQANGRWYGRGVDGTRVFLSGEEPIWGNPGDVPLLGDLDGDGIDELIQWRPSTGRWYALRVDGTRVFPPGGEPMFGALTGTPLVGDLDGDGDEEMIIYTADGHWLAMLTERVPLFGIGEEPKWGNPGDVPLVGDLDGDGEDEMIVWRTSSYRWYALRANGTRVFEPGAEPQWGTRGDIPMVTNLESYWGDDMVVWRPSNGKWYAKRVDDTRVFTAGAEPSYGIDGDIPLPGNFDGYGAPDMGIWRPSTARWYGRSVSGVTHFSGVLWGIPYSW